MLGDLSHGLAAGRLRRWTGTRVAVTVLCGAVHVVTLAFVASGVWALWPGSDLEVKALGVLCLMTAVALRPVFPRAAKGAGLVDPVTAPATRALVAEIAACVNAPLPTRLEVTTEINASASRTGLHGRTLGFGAPLWMASSHQARVAILAHELAHFANGDPIRGRYVAGALQTLDHWLAILTPVNTRRRSLRGEPAIGRGPNPGVQRLFFWPFRAAIAGYAHLIDLVAAPDHRRGEAIADLRAAVAAGTDGAVDGLEVGLAALGIEVAVNRAAVRREDLAPALLEFRAQFGPEQRAGARRSGAAEHHRIGSDHPLTTDRLKLLESTPPREPRVRRTPQEWAEIEAEWAPAVAGRLRALAEPLRYRH